MLTLLIIIINKLPHHHEFGVFFLKLNLMNTVDIIYLVGV